MDQRAKQILLKLALPLAILLSMLAIYFPLPTRLLDFLLAANIGFSVVLLLATVFVKSPLELKVFPSLLLVTTLTRLSLNVATTRLILGNGAVDKELAAGEVVKGFAEFVAGDSIIVGSIIFLILFIIQFVVITKGATRIGEVAARFALDSMPGRQMAIDGDLANGSISWEEAQRRRKELIQYADFQGAMDGASKYVRGDAIAGLLIIVVNILGGLFQGLVGGMSLDEAVTVFTRLTIGDGLVSQLPALLISIAAGLLVTRGTEESDLPSESVGQLLTSPMAMWIAAAFLIILPLAGLPAIPLLTLGGVLIFMGVAISRSNQEKVKNSLTAVRSAMKESKIEKYLETDQIELQVGVQLLSLCNSQSGGTVIAEVSSLRGEIAGDLGIVLPKVRIRDNLQLAPQRFRILLDGNPVFEGTLEKDKMLNVYTRDAFPMGEPKAGFAWAPYAAWSTAPVESKATSVRSISPTKAIAKSLQWVVHEYADQLLTRDATNELIEETRKSFPRLVGDTIPDAISLGQLQKVFRQLLREGMALRPMHLILETIGEFKSECGDVNRLVSRIRESLQRHTAQRLAGKDGKIICFGISDELTESLEDSLTDRDEATASGKFSASIRKNLRSAIQSGVQHLLTLGHRPVLFVNALMADVVKRTVSEIHPRVFVLGEDEISNPSMINLIAEITPGDIAANDPSAHAA